MQRTTGENSVKSRKAEQLSMTKIKAVSWGVRTGEVSLQGHETLYVP